MEGIGLNELVDEEQDDADLSEHDTQEGEDIGSNDEEEGIDWSGFYDSLDEDEREDYLEILTKKGEGELRDRLIKDHGIINDPQPFINDLKKYLRDHSEESDDEMIRKGESFEERAVNGDDNVLGVFDVGDEEELDEDEDVEDTDDGEDVDEDDSVSEYLDILKNDMSAIPKKSVKKELDSEEFDRLRSHESVEVDDFNVKWVGD